jgi:heme/copper-type cytochrome/quinol oxidase subunit 3
VSTRANLSSSGLLVSCGATSAAAAGLSGYSCSWAYRASSSSPTNQIKNEALDCSSGQSITIIKSPWPSILAGFVCFFLSAQASSAFTQNVYWGGLNFILIFNLWIRDLVRETAAKKCSLVPLGVFLFGFALFVLSEAIFFVSIFWASFHLTSSPFFSFQEALFIPDPCELTYGNTLLLSNAAVSLGSAYITRESLLFFGSPHSASFVFAWTFLSLQIKEFRNLGFYVSDSVYGCVFFFLSGFHFFHVVVGLVLLGILSSIPMAFGLSGSLCISQDFFFLFQVLYWHLVELVWQFLFVILYFIFPLGAQTQRKNHRDN